MSRQEWMSEQTNERTKAKTNKRTNDLRKARRHARTNERMLARTHERTKLRTKEQKEIKHSLQKLLWRPNHDIFEASYRMLCLKYELDLNTDSNTNEMNRTL